ncbi:MAG: ATP-binding protein, partial [Gemmatimonas sp.]
MPMSPDESLLEREPALVRLHQALAAARAGQGRCVVIGGEAGIGKTSLLAAWAASPATREGGTRWLQGGCDPLRTPRPLGPLVDLCASLPAELTNALHHGRTYNGLFPSLLAWLRQSRPVSVLVIEDLHWADEATLDCVRYLGRRLSAAGFLLVLTLRQAEAAAHPPLRQTLAALDADATDRLDLPALSLAAVDALAARHGRPAQGLHALTGGNPFYLKQVLKSAPGTLPGTLHDMVLSQADALPPLQRELVDTLGCSPGGLELDALLALHPEAMAAMTAPPDAPGPSAQALLQVKPPWLSFRHELARQVIESALPPLKRWQIHRRLLDHMKGRPGDTPRPGLLARQVHHAAAAGLQDEVMALAPRAAAESEAVGAYRSAVQLLQLALEHAGNAPPAQRAALLDRLALRSYLIQATEQSLAARREAIRLKQQAGDTVGSAVSLAQLAVQITPDPQALDLARQAVAALAPGGDTVEHGVALSALAISLVNAGPPSEALQHARHALRCAAALGDEESRAHATSMSLREAIARASR